MTVCPICGSEFSDEGGFCPFDGGRLKPAGAVIVPRVPTRERVKPRATPGREELPTRDPEQPTGLVAIPGGDGTPEVLAHLLRGDHDPFAGHDAVAGLVGQTLDGRYHITARIGEGGMGVVFRAEHVVIEKPVAIKVLKLEAAREESVVQRFIQEARAASRIGHPNIVDVTDFGTTPDGLTYQVMEYVEGTTLAAALGQAGTFALPRALPIIAQLCRALGAAHGKGIVHRDLKPENIFLLHREGRDDFVKVVDFGIAKVAPTSGEGGAVRLTRAGSVFGTPEYMAPEQAAGRTDTDHRIDIYALGTIFYEMLVGDVPFRGATPVRTIAMQLMEEVVPPRIARPDLDLPAALEAAVMKALAKQMDERFPTMAAFLAAIVAVVGKRAIELGTTAQSLPPGPLASTVGATAIGRPGEAPGPSTRPTRSVLDARAPLVAEAAPQALEATQPTDKIRPLPGPPPTRSGARSEVVEAAPRRRGDAPLIAACLAIVVLSAGAVAYATGALDGLLGRRVAAAPAAAALDAGPARVAPPDATAASPPPIDAGPPPDATAAPPPRRERRDRRRPLAAGDAEVTVHTRPDGGRLFIDGEPAGPDGTHIQRARGTTLRLTCRKPGYLDGAVEVVFDGVNEIYLCKLGRKKQCVPGLKNPFDDCPEE